MRSRTGKHQVWPDFWLPLLCWLHHSQNTAAITNKTINRHLQDSMQHSLQHYSWNRAAFASCTIWYSCFLKPSGTLWYLALSGCNLANNCLQQGTTNAQGCNLHKTLPSHKQKKNLQKYAVCWNKHAVGLA